MNVGGAYGGGKAGGSFDPILFVQRPQVILRGLSWVSNFTEKQKQNYSTTSNQISVPTSGSLKSFNLGNIENF